MRILFYRIIGKILIIEEITTSNYAIVVRGCILNGFESKKAARKDLKYNKAFYIKLLKDKSTYNDFGK